MSENKFTICCENTSDLPEKYFSEHNVKLVPIIYSIEDKEYDGTFENSLTSKEFYDKLRNGHMSKTAACSPDTLKTIFKEELDKGNDVLYLGFSSGLSSTFQSSAIVQEELSEEYPDRKLIVIDTLAASLGQGLICDFAVREKEAGKSIDEIADSVRKMIPHTCHYFTVDDLNHLHRGGRVSKTVAIIGTVLGIKPVMHVDDAGKLIPYGKVRGRRQSLDSLVDRMGTKIKDYDYKNPYVFISHGDCLDDAEYVSKQIKTKYGIKTDIINPIGPVIGSHSGPGTVALFFFGINKKEN